MKQYPFLESKAGKAGFGIFLFVMLLLSRDTLITSCLIGFTKSQFLMLGLICILGLAFLVSNRRDWKQILLDKRMAAVLISTALILLPMLLKRDWQMMYFSILICLFFAIFLSYFTFCRQVSRYYLILIAILGAYSVFATYFLKELTMAGKLSVPVFYNSSEWPFYNYGLCYVVTWENWNRNFGIFREPGVYQFFVILGLYLNNYVADWEKNWQIWLLNAVLAVVMITTFAVGGFIEMALFALFLYFDKKWYTNKWGKLGAAAVLAAVLAMALYILWQSLLPGFALTIYYELYDMLLRLTTKSDSLVDRLSAIFTNAGLFLKSPLLGDTISNVLHGTNHNTSSTLILYAVLGIAGGSLNVAAWAALVWKKQRNVFGNLFLLLILFMSFNTQNLVADVFFWLFPMMALLERGLPFVKLPKKKV